MGIFILRAAAGAAPMFSGSWSAITLVALVVSIFTSVVLGVVLLVTGLSGGFAATAPQPPSPPMQGSLSAAYREAAREIANERAGLEPNERFGAIPPPKGTDAAPTEDADASKPPPTGLWQLLAAFFACVPVALVWSFVDNPQGASTGFTPGAALALLLLAGQFFLCGWYVRIRRRRAR